MKPAALAFLVKPDLLALGSGFFVLLSLSAVVSFFANAKYSESGSSQPIAFNHRLHVEDEGLECSTCHNYYEHETFSGMPSMNACVLCHSEMQGESAEEGQLVAAIEAGTAVEWAPLFRQPPHVFFSHRRHVVAAELECATCHGDIGQSESPPTNPRRLTMDLCIACHSEHGIAENCASCHR